MRGNWPVLRVAVPPPVYAQVMERAKIEGKPVSRFCRELIVAILYQSDAQVKDSPQPVLAAMPPTDRVREALIALGGEERWIADVLRYLAPGMVSEDVHAAVDVLLAAGQIKSRIVVHGEEPRRMISLCP